MNSLVKRVVAGAGATASLIAGTVVAGSGSTASATTTSSTTVRSYCVGRTLVRCAVLGVDHNARTVTAYGSIRNAAGVRGLYVWVRSVRLYYYSHGWTYYYTNPPVKFYTGWQVASKSAQAYGASTTRSFYAKALLEWKNTNGTFQTMWISTPSAAVTL